MDLFGKVENNGEDKLLQNAVKNAYIRASELNQSSISIPAISSGSFGYPIERAWKMIARATKSYLDHKDEYNNTLDTIVMCSLLEEVIYLFHILDSQHFTWWMRTSFQGWSFHNLWGRKSWRWPNNEIRVYFIIITF